ncbi:hypothetical protein RSUY_25950 [Ralstonia solanacearum]|nr:hypothetical protein RSUY_25950 [Ralstonia solanacearum]
MPRAPSVRGEAPRAVRPPPILRGRHADAD